MTPPLNLSDDDFTRTLQEIDAVMSSRGEQIQGRELRGWMAFCARYDLRGLSMFDPLSERVLRWFSARYGERVNLDTDLGHSIVMVRGDILRFRCAGFYGRVLEISCPELMRANFEKISTNGPVISNVLSLVSGITSTYAASLNPDDRDRLLRTIVKSKIRLARIADAGNYTYVREGRADLRTSVEQLALTDSQFGPSKWSSLQAVEKFLKAYIAQQVATFRKVHDLNQLADRAESLGLRRLDRSNLRVVQCPADVRYNSSLVSRDEAVSAHHAAVWACSEIADQLSGQSGWTTGVIGKTSLRFQGLSEPVAAILIARMKQPPRFNRQLETEL
jgi:hypothetical protein